MIRSIASKTLLATLTISVLGLASLLGATHVSASTDIIPVGTNLQDAIDLASPGDVLQLQAGTYTGDITIDKPLTIEGVQAGNDARNRTGSETVIKVPAGSKRGIVVGAANVTIDGITIDGTDGDDPTTGIFAYNTTSSDLHVVNSIFRNNSVGVDMLGTDRSGLVVSQNLFDHNGKSGSGDGVYITRGTGSGVTITDNDFKDTDDGTAGSTNAILVNGGTTETLSGLTITGNTSNNDGSFVYLTNVTDTTIKNNTSDAQAGHGVMVGDGVDQLTIDSNTFTNSASAVNLSAPTTPATNVTITNNTMTGMSRAGILIADGSISGSPTIKDNTITGNTLGIDNSSNVTIDANNNWWGCAEGPDTSGCNTVNGPVTATVWYTDAAMTTVNATDADGSNDNAPEETLANTGGNMTLPLVAGVLLTVVGTVAMFMHQRLARAR